MRGYFDDAEPEPQPDEPRRDSEVTLSWGALAGIAICLVLVCGMCFGIGYTLGKRSAAPSAAAAQPATQTAAPDQEPLQGSGSVPKPSAAEQAPVTAPAPADEGTQPSMPGDAGASPAPSQPSPAQAGQQAQAPVPAAQTQVQPAMPIAEHTPQPAAASAAPGIHAALPAQQLLMVQIAAVVNPADADVLVNALRRRNYNVTARRDPADGLIHVRLGPFTSREEAIRWQDKLLGDGYNAEIQP